jgi:ABC-type nitrate/sulfonate/bicarbonate transport system permease component
MTAVYSAVTDLTDGTAADQDALGQPGAGNWPRRAAKAVVVSVARGALTLVTVIAAWYAFLAIFHVQDFVGKTPLDVWRYLVDAPAGNLSQFYQPSLITLRDAGLGLAAGTVAAVGASLSFVLWRVAAAVVMPMAMVLRSVPLVAMTPLIVGIFGRDLTAITIIAALVTFFPTLVNVSLALRRTPQESLDLCHAYGATPLITLWKVQIPNALPALFASLRIAAPLALTGALLAEWLATGQGLGNQIITAQAQSEYDLLWSGVVLVTLYSMILYDLIGLAERMIMRRFGAVLTGRCSHDDHPYPRHQPGRRRGRPCPAHRRAAGSHDDGWLPAHRRPRHPA